MVLGAFCFSVNLYHSSLQVSTVRNYRSVLTAIHPGLDDGFAISVMHHLLRGMFITRPPVKRLVLSWDLDNFVATVASLNGNEAYQLWCPRSMP